MRKRLLAARHGESEAGYTLTEVLVALMILSVAIVAIVGAMGSSIFSSRVHRSVVTGDTAVRAYAEQILQGGYVPCATPSGANQYPTMTNAPGGFTVTITNITYYTGTAPGVGNVPTAQFSPTCPSPDNAAQKIVILAQPLNNAGKQSLAIVKRAP